MGNRDRPTLRSSKSYPLAASDGYDLGPDPPPPEALQRYAGKGDGNGVRDQNEQACARRGWITTAERNHAMERLNFLAWLGAIGGLAGLGIGVMIWAYRGSGSRAVLFTEPIPLPQTPPGLNDAKALDYFESGRQAFQEQNYQEALMEWTRAIQLAPNFAEAYHNRALVAVNLRRDGEAARDLARAGDLYLEQGNPEGVATIRQNFEAMKTRTTS